MGVVREKENHYSSDLIFYDSMLFILDPILFSRWQGSAKARSGLKIRSDLRNKIAGASGLFTN